jgi:O-antigen ligase
MALWLAAVVAATALIVTPGWLFYFDVTPKLVVLLTGAAVAALWRPSGRVPRWFTLLLSLSFISLAISTALSSNRTLSLYGANWRRFGLLEHGALLLFAWLVAAHTAGREDRVRTILRGVAIAAAVASLYGIAQYFGWDPLLPAAAYHIGEGIWTIVRPPGTLGYVSYFANWLLLAAFLCWALVKLEAERAWRYLAISAAALSIIAMLLTGTRAAILGLAVGALWGGLRFRRRVLAAALVAMALFYVSPLGWQLRSRTRWFVEDPFGGARRWLWRDSLRMSASHWIAGFGPEVFTPAFPHYESEDLARAYPDFSHESPHNIFLDVLVAQGLLGLLPLLALRGFGKHSAVRPLASGLAAAVVSQQFVVFILPTALLFYVTIALAVALSSKPAAEESPPRLNPIAIPVALTLLYFAARFTLADHALALAQSALAARDVKTAALRYAAYESRRMPGTSAALWYSRSLLNVMNTTSDARVRLQLFPIALAAAQNAARESEDPANAWYTLAGLYALENDAAATERSLRQAIAANPVWYKPHWTLAQLLRLQGRMDDAASESALAARLNGGKNPEVQRTLDDIRLALHR